MTKKLKKKIILLSVITFLFVSILVLYKVGPGLLLDFAGKLDRNKMFVEREGIDIGISEDEPDYTDMLSDKPTASPPSDKTDGMDSDLIVTPGNSDESVDLGLPASVPDKYSIYYGGEYYIERDDLVTVLFMGIDLKSKTLAEEYDTSFLLSRHQSDTLLLMVFNTEKSTVSIINIPRDIIVDLRLLDISKRYYGTKRDQLCLQYAYGGGGALSCELTCQAVKNILYGVPINQYIAMDIQGIAVAADAVGGVDVKIREDFSMVPAYAQKYKQDETVFMDGATALEYLSIRMSINAENMQRVQRQLHFCEDFLRKVKADTKKNPSFVINFYNKIKNNILTNLSIREILYLSKIGLSIDLSADNVYTIEGVMMSDGFYVDEDRLKAFVIENFYEKVVN